MSSHREEEGREGLASYPVSTNSSPADIPPSRNGYDDNRAGGESMWGASPDTSNSSGSGRNALDPSVSLPGSGSRAPRLVESFDSGADTPNISQYEKQLDFDRQRKSRNSSHSRERGNNRRASLDTRQRDVDRSRTYDYEDDMDSNYPLHTGSRDLLKDKRTDHQYEEVERIKDYERRGQAEHRRLEALKKEGGEASCRRSPNRSGRVSPNLTPVHRSRMSNRNTSNNTGTPESICSPFDSGAGTPDNCAVISPDVGSPMITGEEETSWSSMHVNEDELSGLDNLKNLTPDDSLCSYTSNDHDLTTPTNKKGKENRHHMYLGKMLTT